MAFPTDFSDVSATDPITASRNNAITKKIGLTALATLGATTGHFSLPTSAGIPSGDPVNGAGSMVWDNSNNSLYINEDGSDSSWAIIGGGGSAFTDPVTITDDDSDPLLIITQSASNTGFLQFAQGGHTLTWTKSSNSFLLSHSANSASILIQDNSTITIGGTLAMGTATATGIGFGSHGGVYGYGGSRIHVYPTGSAPLIIGSNTSSNNVLQVFFEAIPVNFQVNVRHHGIAGITASTSQSQGNGALTADVNVIATVGSANDTCTMPTAVTWMRVTVINNGANTMRLYPASGDNLGAGVDTLTTLAAGSNITYQAIDLVNWEVV